MKKIIYEPHPVSVDRKIELIKAGFKIIDAIFKPKGEKSVADDDEKNESVAAAPKKGSAKKVD